MSTMAFPDLRLAFKFVIASTRNRYHSILGVSVEEKVYSFYFINILIKTIQSHTLKSINLRRGKFYVSHTVEEKGIPKNSSHHLCIAHCDGKSCIKERTALTYRYMYLT
jgi:hypothetical protein